jgi:hypothetical protein
MKAESAKKAVAKVYKPYEVKPFTIILKEGKTIYSKDVVRRFDTFSWLRDVAEAAPETFTDKMTVRGINAILDGLIANPKTTFDFDGLTVEDDDGTAHMVKATVKFAKIA